MKKNNERRITKNRINTPSNKDSIDSNRSAIEPSSYKNKKIENVLVLQGGGPLGAFGCGVFKAIANNNIKLDFIAGTSIGGVNAAIIAGSKDQTRT
jgi:predicted acylesterase/phospholipase RssA